MIRNIKADYTKSSASDLYIPSHLSVDTPIKCVESDNQKKQTNDDKHKRLERTHIIYSIFITAIGVVITFISLHTSCKATKIAEKSQELSIAVERPYIGIKSTSTKQFVANNTIIVDLIIQNTGNTPAYNVTIKSRTVVSPKKFDGNAKYKAGSIDGIYLPQNSEHPHPIFSDQIITKAQYDSVVSGKAFLFIYALVEYESTLAGRRYTQIHIEYNHESKRFRFGNGYNNAN